MIEVINNWGPMLVILLALFAIRRELRADHNNLADKVDKMDVRLSGIGERLARVEGRLEIGQE